jgi:hypothetical protein
MRYITAPKLNPFIFDFEHSFEGVLRLHISGSILRGILKVLTKITDNIAPLELKNDAKMFLLAQARAGKSYLIGSVVIACFLLSNWKQTIQNFGTILTNQEIAIKPVYEVLNQELNNRKDVKDAGTQNCNSSFIKLLDSLKLIEILKRFQRYPVFQRSLLPLDLFTDLIPFKGLKQLFASNHQKLLFWQGTFELFANPRLCLKKLPTIDYRKTIQLSLFRWQFEKINLRRDVINYLMLKSESDYLLNNQSYLFGFAEITIKKLAGYLNLMRKFLFRRFIIDNQCDFIFLVEMPP